MDYCIIFGSIYINIDFTILHKSPSISSSRIFIN
uniref:Uncharacterized protein n=1 Tax=virus sp. ctrcb4 TaxID=2825824 RepID=A0A8S5RPU7_9VIRU|nr:MAG TPA: hypothetical protein [virus sp. ctrcb4]DAR12582.1 MAG TPA: hypothetical protein [Crassvirales sp.]